MRYVHQVVPVAALVVGVAGLYACVGDNTVSTPDATTDAANDVTTQDVQVDGAVGCASRTADDATGVFVATTGSDVTTCGARGNPCRSLTYAIAAAKATVGKTTVYVAAPVAAPGDGGAGDAGDAGSTADAGGGLGYQESIILDAPLSIEGGWSDVGGTWTPICDNTTSTAVTIDGVTNTTITASFAGSATLRDIRVRSKASADPSESLYGIFVLGASTNLTLDQVVVNVAPGGDGPNGTDGTSGTSATDAGCNAGSGTAGSAGQAGAGGAAGVFSSSGYVGHNGGNGGVGGSGSNGTAGGAGQCSSSCQTCSFNGTCSFGTTTVCGTNGVAGCAGGGGGAGSFGVSGGSSIAVFLWGAHLTVFGGSFTTGNGGNGGNGGAGADGGAPTAGKAGTGGSCATGMHCNSGCFLDSATTESGGSAGGTGGAGGSGGNAGGGSGGFSYDFVSAGDGGVVLNGNPPLVHGQGGTGGTVNGASGQAGPQWP